MERLNKERKRKKGRARKRKKKRKRGYTHFSIYPDDGNVYPGLSANRTTVYKVIK